MIEFIMEHCGNQIRFRPPYMLDIYAHVRTLVHWLGWTFIKCVVGHIWRSKLKLERSFVCVEV